MRGANNRMVLEFAWQQYPTRQLLKCAHALSLRATFPECEGLYIDGELHRRAIGRMHRRPRLKGWTGLNLFLVDWGLSEQCRRSEAITRLRADLPGLLEAEPQQFGQEAVLRLMLEPDRYGARPPPLA